MENNSKVTINEKYKKAAWFDARDIKNKEQILPLVYSLRYEYLIINYDDIDTIKVPRKMKLVVSVKKDSKLDNISKEHILLCEDHNFLIDIKDQGYSVALLKTVRNQEDMELAWKHGEKFNYVIVELIDDTNIPLELIIARLQNRSTSLLKIVRTCQEAEVAFGVMESGSDGVILKTEQPIEIVELDKLIGKGELGKLEIVKAKVSEVSHVGMGYRACIDTTNLLGKNEGMIIGSTSSGGILVSSETHFLPYMETRPFRVNAGAVHSYVWVPSGMTNYLTELKGGSRILCVDVDGNTREVTVGRVKMELRPLLKIEAEHNGTFINAIVQDDWHIRIFGGNGQPRNVSTIVKGDEILAYTCRGGRHVGIEIDENLEEH